MKSIILNFLLILSVPSSLNLAQAADFTYDTVIKKLAFGSGHSQRKDASHWKAVNTELPDVWVWLGEITQTTFATPKSKKKAYDEVLKDVGYQEVRSRSQILGVWDDEDAKPNSKKTRKAFFEFLNEPFESPRYSRDALYASYLLGPVGKRIKLILLDTFTNRNKSSANRTLLGEKQWAWLEKELDTEKEKVDVLLIATPLSFLGHDSIKESWRGYEAEQSKLIHLVDKLNFPAYIISGHNRYAEFSALKLSSGKTLTEVSSSGLNIPRRNPPNNPHRVGEAITDRNFGILEFQWPTTESTEELKVIYRIQNI